MKETTLVICGSLKKDTYEFYERFYQENPKVFSTWEGSDRKEGWRMRDASRPSPSTVVIQNANPERFGVYERRLELMAVSALSGLARVGTKFAIVLRGDEWYSNLHAVEEMMVSDPGRIFTTPIFFRKWEACPFHPSSHLMASLSDNLKTMFSQCMVNMVTKRPMHDGRPLRSESVLAKGYLDVRVATGENLKAGFKRLFGIVSLDSLKYYKAVSDYSDKVWYSNFKPEEDGTWERSISSMEEA